MNSELETIAKKNVQDILRYAIEYTNLSRALIVYDDQFGLTNILLRAYRQVIPDAIYINFDTTPKEEILANISKMQENDLVILIQSGSFRLDEFRIRLHLFNKGLRVIEHTHLHRNTEDTWKVYLDSLAYDPTWYRTTGPALQQKLAHTQTLQIQYQNTELIITGGLEHPKLNIGDYSGMKNIGGTFPIGEVFTEGKDFSRINGSLMLYGIAGTDFCIQTHTPFRVDFQEGLVVDWDENTPKHFIDTISSIKEKERPLLRELGFGLNRAITLEHHMQDITAFERILGLHCSLGEKHSVYKKPGITSDKARFHVDVFPMVDVVLADGEPIFKKGTYLL